MQLQCQQELSQTTPSVCVIVGVYKDASFTPLAEKLNKESQGYLAQLLKDKTIKSDIGSTLYLPMIPNHNGKVLLVSCGDKNTIDSIAFRKILKKTAQQITTLSAETVYCELTALPVMEQDQTWKTLQIVDVFHSAFYRFNYFKTENKNSDTSKLLILQTDEKSLEKAKALSDSMTLLKDLANSPANICTPTYLSEKAIELGKTYSTLSVEILEEKDMESLKMGSLLSVNQGSKQPAKLICLKHEGASNNQKPIVFIGKGVTFDTGGTSLKPSAALDEMKYDMCGGATVIALLQLAAQLSLPLNIVGLVPAVENMPGGGATRPGDIVKSMSGKTIEILNTDAEGRLILCDAMTYAEKYDPEFVVDIATLTGSAILTFNHVATAVMGNNESLVEELLSAAKKSGERAWPLPLWEEFQDMLSSNFADLPNIHSDNNSKCIIAGCFLSRFANKYPWAHLDIAGTASIGGKDKGATGRPLHMLLTFLLDKNLQQ